MESLPQAKVRFIESRFGAAGREYVEALPQILDDLSTRWQLEIDTCLDAGLPLNFVFLARQHNQPVILKTGYPHPEQQTEIAALNHWAQHPLDCSVKLLSVDKDIGAVLLEQLIPGVCFRDAMRLEEAKPELAELRQLFADIPRNIGHHERAVPTFSDWLERAHSQLDQHQHPDHARHLSSALRRYAELVDDKNWLLHGDLHHENILLHGNVWTAVDPKGVIGPRVMEYGRFLHNFLEDEAAPFQEVIPARAAALVGEFSQQQLLRSAFIDLALAMTWSLNDGGSVKEPYPEVLQFLSEV